MLIMDSTDLRNVLSEALIKGKGYTREAADHTVDEIMDHADSAEALSGAVNDLMSRLVEDQNLWDWDADQVCILVDFLEWIPDMALHAAAWRLREQIAEIKERESWRNPRAKSAMLAGMNRAVQMIDPFKIVKDDAGDLKWIRKHDGAAVPERVASTE